MKPFTGRPQQLSLLNVKPTEQHRWPRGYSPGRMRRIKGMLDPVITMSPIPGNHGHPFWGQAGKRHIEEAVARSTVPESHLAGLKEIQVRKPLMGMRNNSTVAQYTTRKAINIYTSPVSKPKRGQFAGETLYHSVAGQAPRPEGLRSGEALEEAGTTLLHELGHHHSQGPASGFEEGQADRYMLEHFRRDPRVLHRRQFDPGNMTYSGRGIIPGTAEEGGQTYTLGRTTPLPAKRMSKSKREMDVARTIVRSRTA